MEEYKQGYVQTEVLNKGFQKKGNNITYYQYVCGYWEEKTMIQKYFLSTKYLEHEILTSELGN